MLFIISILQTGTLIAHLNLLIVKIIRGSMYNASHLEKHFKNYMLNLTKWLPEGIIPIDIETLHNFGLLNYSQNQDSTLTRYFHVIESNEKITLINDQFIVWIVPDNSDGHSMTQVLIALNKKGIPQLELAFVASDVYNTSKLVLRLLEKFLFEIQENEDILKPYKEAS